MRCVAATLWVLLALGACAATATAAETWHSQQPSGGGSFPLLGEVGDIECWNGEANRCLLITAGNAGVAPGLFAYDGSGWYRYSTVCGGHEGRIAWAGPTEFWTISDQQPGQVVLANPSDGHNLSLCRFKDGRVVASYGEPIEAASSYRHMRAAACAGSGNCWFGGERLSDLTSVNPGAFHLHWNGSSVTATPSPIEVAELSDPGRAVTGIAFHRGSFYEGVDVEEGDVANEEEELAAEASFLHRIGGPGEPPFQPLFGEGAFNFGLGTETELQGFHLTGSDAEDLWALAGSTGEATPTVLRLAAEGLTQLPLEDPEAVLGPEILVNGAAAEPGRGDIWVSLRPTSDPLQSLTTPAKLTRIHNDGEVEPMIALPLAGEELGGEPIGNKGSAGPIACPASEQCWLATRMGWLFHLGPDPTLQSDPAMHVLVTSRPPDHSLPVLPPLELPEDNSGAESRPSEQEQLSGQIEEFPKTKPALLSRIKQRLIGGTLLELSFTLRAKAEVWLVAKREGRVVARTRRQAMAKGRRSVRLRLDPKRWPTKLDLKARALTRKGSK